MVFELLAILVEYGTLSAIAATSSSQTSSDWEERQSFLDLGDEINVPGGDIGTHPMPCYS